MWAPAGARGEKEGSSRPESLAETSAVAVGFEQPPAFCLQIIKSLCVIRP